MTAPATIRSGVGFRECQIMALDTSGYPAATTTAAYAGVTLSGARTLEITDPEPQQIVHRGDDRPFALDVLPAQEPMSGALVTGKTDDVAEAVISDGKSFTVGEAKLFAVGHDKRGDEPQVALLAYRQSMDTDPDSANYGKRSWEFRLFPKVLVIPMESGFSENPEEKRYSLKPQFVSKHLWGTTLSTSTEGVSQAQGFRGIAEYKPKIVAWMGDNSNTAFTFPTDAVAVSAAKVALWVNGTLQTTGFTAATDGVTFATAPTTSAMVVAFYEVA